MRIFSTLFFLLLFLNINYAQSSALWSDVEEAQLKLSSEVERQVFPNKFRLVSLDVDGMKSYLKDAPAYTGKASQKTLEIEIPLPNNVMETFEIYEKSVMQSGIAARYPSIKTYLGSNPKTGSIIALGYGPQGFHAAISMVGSTFYIDAYAKGNSEYYMSYNVKEDLENWGNPQKLSCGLTDQSVFEDFSNGLSNDQAVRNRTRGALVDQKTFIIAIAATGEFSSSRGNDVDDIVGVFNQVLTRVNIIWGPELSTQLVLHDETDKLIWMDPNTDPYPVGNVGGEILSRNQDVFNARIGLNTYDIGHAMTNRCTDVGGVASGANSCTNGKAGGMTCNGFGLNISTMAHEMGHQNSVSHSWDNCPGNDGQRASRGAFEPGSGSTIMSYSGACGSENLGADDDYYSNGSLAQFRNWAFRVHEGCGTLENPGNHVPDIQWPYTDGFYIPKGTPFELEATATDDDGDNLAYSWEQHNLRGVATFLGMPIGNCPIYRSYPAVANGYRSFPRADIVINPGINTPAWERTVDYGRDWNFTLTVRDNHPTAGGVIWEEVAFHSDNAAGPFLVTSQASDTVVWEGGQAVDITWDVANTKGGKINAGAVDIYFSANRGVTWDILLAKATLNDGHERVFAPNLTTSNARIKIKGTDNIFYNVNTTNFKVEEATQPSFTASVSPQFNFSCLPNDLSVSIETGSILNYDSLLTVELLTTLPNGITASLSSDQVMPGENATLDLTMTNDLGTGELPLEVIIYGNGTDTVTKEILLEFSRNDFSALRLLTPNDGQGGIPEQPIIEWNNIADADIFDFQLATSPAFAPGDIIEEEQGMRDTFFIPNQLLEENTPYYWRVRPFNICGAGDYTTPFSFHTVSKECKTKIALEGDQASLSIPGASVQTITSSIPVLDQGIINDLNIPIIKGSYEPITSLKMTLISPQDTRAILFQERCNGSVFNFGFDDAVNSRNPCPPNDGKQRGPQEFLNRFNGEELTGTWSLEIEVVKPGNGGGGSLQEWQLEFCADLALQAPKLLRNETLPVNFGLGEQITPSFLEVEDQLGDEIEPWDLVYTVVTLPEFGILSKNGNPMSIGDNFTQFNINQGLIWYRHLDTNMEPDDNFLFTIRDKDGGWLGNQQFNFSIDLTSSTDDVNQTLENNITLFPNPADATLNIQINEQIEDAVRVELYNAQGKLMKLAKFENINSILKMDVSNLTEGFYFVSIKTTDGRATKRLMIGR